MAKEQRCVVCKDPLGDSEALVVTGKKTGRTHYVHRPTSPDRALCFHYGVYGADVQSIVLKSPDEPGKHWDIQLAIQMGLDRMACESVGVDWASIRRLRRGKGRRARTHRS